MKSKRTISWWNSVPMIARAIPIAACCMPRRARSGLERLLRPRMNRTEEAR